MNREIPRPGEKYLHFKNKMYQILCVAEHTETGEKMVVYQALYGAFACYTRPLVMFMEEVDHEKYPEILQKYRFERMNDTQLQRAAILSDPLPGHSANSSKTLQSNQEDADPVLHSPENPEEEQADPALLRFLDADTLEEKYQLLKSMERSITHRLIDDFSAVLDLVIPEGSLDFRYHQLLSSIGTMQRYENTRLR